MAKTKVRLAIAIKAGMAAIAMAGSSLMTANAEPVWVANKKLDRIDNITGLDRAALNARAEIAAERILNAGRGELKAVRSEVDNLGVAHVRLHQMIRGKRVYGADLVLHASGDGDIFLVNGNFVKAKGAPEKASLKAEEALGRAMSSLSVGDYDVVEKPSLAYVVGFDGASVHLAWRALVEYEGKDGLARDYVFADALTGQAAAVDAVIQHAKVWRTYDANNDAYTSRRMPGTLVCQGNQPCPDMQAQDAHDGAGITYDYYLAKFGRDSLDGNGLALISSVHVCDRKNCSGWNNASWIGTQMVYGDGDGYNFYPLSGDLDVVAHELTHGVTDYTSDLVYQNASGALNEALSDIFGASVEAWSEGGINVNTWKLGEDIIAPGYPYGDALRFMNNPTLDEYSTDYYPERIPETSAPSGNNDYGGVHGNSGIFNLAYVLLVEGGSHPRGKTSVFVSGVGLAKAEQIMYRANSVYYTSSTGYQAAADGAEQAAIDLYGNGSERQAVLDAFCAVGVGANCGGSNGVAPVASFTASCPNLSCAFTDDSTDSDGNIVGWNWSFGDGATSTAQNPSHTYSSGGNYTVTLTVTDNDGNADADSQSINVSAGGGDNTPPVISNVTSTTGKGGNFTVSWTTDEPATSVLRIPSANYTNSDSALTTSHALTQRGSKNATYIYYVDSVDAAGNSSTAGPFTHQN